MALAASLAEALLVGEALGVSVWADRPPLVELGHFSGPQAFVELRGVAYWRPFQPDCFLRANAEETWLFGPTFS